ncbi:MAG: inorganic pyrophosphatase [Hyphomicrobium sp.]|nr:MAG: inorganic pyrophosphatase [Hyphomicrobium sp.]
MFDYSKLSPFDEKGRVQMVVESPRGSSIKFKYDDKRCMFTVSRSLAMGLTYPFDWGFIPGTNGDDGDAVDAVCIHDGICFPGVLLPCRCLALLEVDQQSSGGRVSNPRVILVPAWDGGQLLGVDVDLSDRAKAEIEQFFLSATLFTDKDARIVGWHDHVSAANFIHSKRT